MATILIVAPVFALIALGYIAVRAGFVSEGANKGIFPSLRFRSRFRRCCSAPSLSRNFRKSAPSRCGPPSMARWR